MEAGLVKLGAKNPQAVAAHIGRQKYGAKRMAELAQAAKRKAGKAAAEPDAAPKIRRRIRL